MKGNNQMRKNVQIPFSLFIYLVQYFVLDMASDELFSKIEKAMETKVDAIIMHDLYAKYKTAPSDEEREKARLEYLEKRGISESFRW